MFVKNSVNLERKMHYYARASLLICSFLVDTISIFLSNTLERIKKNLKPLRKFAAPLAKSN